MLIFILLPLVAVLIGVALVTSSRFWRPRHKEPEIPLETGEQEKSKLESLAIEGNSEGLWHWDLATDKFRVSNGWAAILGFRPEDIGDRPHDWFARVHPYYIDGLRMDLAAHLSGKKDRLECEYRICHRDGTHRWVLCRGQAVRDEKGKAVEIAGVQTDVTRLIEVEKRLIQEALHDRLTGLPNRSFFAAKLKQTVDSNRRDLRYGFAILFLDLDRFKEINDTLGHLVGDELLASVAGRLQTCLRPDDFVARFGGDEFVVLLDPVKDPAGAQAVASRIQKSLSQPFQLNGHQLVTQASIGITLNDARFNDPETLMRNADIAMYAAKGEGKGQTRVYESGMYERTHRNWALENDLRGTVKRRELILHYQPQICLKTGRIRGAEALLRWKRQDGQLISPGEFIPLAEKSDLILDIGEWVLRQACEQAVSWRHLEPPLPTQPKISVNVSARQLKYPSFAAVVGRVLSETGLQPDHLELELTETVLLDSQKTAPETLDEIARRGVSIAIDDFGTGYSSMSYLRKLTANVVKLDRSFITDVFQDRRAAALAKGMIGLAHDLGLTVVAEGVEQRHQVEFLRAHDCDLVQGYFTSRPVPAERFREMIVKDSDLISPQRSRSELEIDPLQPNPTTASSPAVPPTAVVTLTAPGIRTTH